MGEPVTLARMEATGIRDAIADPHGMPSLLRWHLALARQENTLCSLTPLEHSEQAAQKKRIAPFLHHDRVTAFPVGPQILKTEEGTEASVPGQNI